MPADAVLATVHYRVEVAGQAIERAVSALRSRRVFPAVVEIRQAAQQLQGALQMLKASGKYPTLEQYVATLVAFYQGKTTQAIRPMSGANIAAEIEAQQGNLLAADPVLTPGSAH